MKRPANGAAVKVEDLPEPLSDPAEVRTACRSLRDRFAASRPGAAAPFRKAAAASETTNRGPREAVPSGLEDPRAEGLPEPLVDPEELKSGGPPPDGIPPIDAPKFLRAGEVGFLNDNEPVLALRINGVERTYPVQILIWHEIVNDSVAGVPVTVSYCPLCNSAIAYDRRVGQRLLDFGTSGKLYQSALVMYDRQTESLWSHFTGQAVAGWLTGTRLTFFPLATVSWRDWRRANPDGAVLSRDTGHQRSYGKNPYPGYDDTSNPPFAYEGEVDGRLAAKERVVGIRAGEEAVAVRQNALVGARLMEIELAGRRLAVWAQPGTASALDADEVSGGRDVGATGVFAPTIEGCELHFTPAGDEGFADRETDSRWDLLGRAVSGPLTGAQLQAVEHVDTFWFAWAAFLPRTKILP